MSQNLSGDAKEYVKNKKFIQELFSKVTDATLPELIKHLEKVEDISKNSDQPETIKEILNGCKEGKEKTVIHFAAARGDVKIFDHLVKEGCDINTFDKDGNNSFFTAVAHSHLDLVKYLLEEHKVDINQKKNNEQTAIHISCNNGDIKMAEFLIKSGIDVNATSEYGRPINLATAMVQIPIIKLLLNNGADPNGDKKQIPPPLILATDMGNKEIFDLLLEKKADVNIVYDEYSVLHVASEKGHIDFVKILIEKGANPEYEAKGTTALEHAKKEQQFEVVAYLRQVTKKPISEQVEKEIEAKKQKELEEQKKNQPLSEEEKKELEKQKEQNKVLAAEQKEKGNEHFQKNENEEAMVFYEKAIELDPTNVVYYSNKAACLIKLKRAQEAVDVCQIARNVDSQWTKLYFREGHAYSELEQYGDSAASYWEALRLEPDNKLYKQLFDRAVALGKKKNRELQRQKK